MSVLDRLGRLPGVVSVGIVIALCLGVGWIDSVTRSDVRLLPFYFTAVAFGAWQLRRAGAVASAALALSCWIGAQWLDAADDWTVLVWTINIATQGVALLSVGLLVALLAEQLRVVEAATRRDALTGLRNRPGLVNDTTLLIDLCRRHGRPFALAFVDLDHFKQVNDRFGHGAGDALLKVCADVIVQNCRSTDVVARLGGDEFVIAMPEQHPPETRVAMERLRESFKQHTEVVDRGVSMTIGVLVHPRAALTLEDMLSRADALMYDAKRAGRDRVLIAETEDLGGAVATDPPNRPG
jgi:diguanylate cyclase (GGDEF)-like protein